MGGASAAGAACTATNADIPIPNANRHAARCLRFILSPLLRILFEPVSEKLLFDIVLPLLVIMRPHDRDILLRPVKHVEPAQLVVIEASSSVIQGASLPVMVRTPSICQATSRRAHIPFPIPARNRSSASPAYGPAP